MLWYTFSILNVVARHGQTTMRAVVQRVSRAQVTVNGEITGQIGLGLLVLLGVGRDDTEADAIYLAEKIAGLRVFEDAQGKMNRSVQDVGGSVLAVSQFTLYGDVRRGKRPSFDAAAPPEKARQLYEFFVQQIRAAGLRCETGRFQEMMKVESVNEGPVTILLDSGKSVLNVQFNVLPWNRPRSGVSSSGPARESASTPKRCCRRLAPICCLGPSL